MIFSQSKKAWASTLENFKLAFQVLPKFASAELALALRVFLSRPTCLPPVLAGGSTINSSSQLQPNKSWSRIPVNCCLAAPQPSLLGVTQGSTAAAGATVSPSLDPTGKKHLATNLSFQGPSQALAEPTWASGIFKLIMSWPVMVTSWGSSGIRSGRPTPASWEGTVLCQCRFLLCIYLV